MVKTRFAPSPTGDLHIGSLRTALYNYLFARHNNGQFLLRIEDTDQARFKEGSIESILEGLKWAGINWDNQEIIYQSSRIGIYKKYAEELIEKGCAYRCFCTPERLAKMRREQEANKQAPKYDRRCLQLSQAEVEGKLKTGAPYVVRMKIPNKMPDGQDGVIFKDLIRGRVKFNLKELDDQVLLKSDGYPTYHLANVIDDYQMQISHVIRAEEWLSSTPKHLLLYQMFGWQPPEFAHIPLILAADKTKLSKRHGATSVLEFKKMGILPQALINYIALLGWNPGDNQEIFTLEALENKFSLDKVQKAGAIFDMTKLEWMDGYYIRQLSVEKLAEFCLPYLVNAGLIKNQSIDFTDEYIKKVVALEQGRMKKISEIIELVDYFFKDVDYATELLKWRKSDLSAAKERLEFLIAELQKVPLKNWTRGALEQFITGLIEAHNLGTGDTLWPMRVALTGQQKSPGPFEVAEILGKKETLERLKRGVEKIEKEI